MNEPTTAPATRNSVELLSVAQDRLIKLMAKLEGLDLFQLRMEMEDEGFIPQGINIGKTILSLEDESMYNHYILTYL